MQSIILDLHQKIINKEVSITSLVKKSQENYLKYIKSNSVITPTYDYALQVAQKLDANLCISQNDLLFGIPYSLKDNISTLNVRTTGGSKFLKDYVPPFSATVHNLLNKTNAILVNKANCDEFGMGGTGLFSAYGYVSNFYDQERIVGGSSSGGVGQIANGTVPFVITSDTGDSIRRPASLTGVVGYKPSSGLISRYGVLPYAPSMDCVGINTKYVSDCAIVAQNIVSFDEKDFTSQRLDDTNFFSNLKQLSNIRINIIKNVSNFLSKEVVAPYEKVIEILKSNGCILKEVTVSEDILKAIIPTYMTISYSEASSCYANLTGINFGLNHHEKSFDEMMFKNRTDGIGKEVVRRLLIGEVLTNKQNFNYFFLHAKKVRTLLVNTYNDLLKDVDCFLLPGASSVAPLIKDVLEKKAKTTYADDLLSLANFAGAPSITIPYTKVNHMPFGININCKILEDQKALNIAYSIENIFQTIRGINE